MSAYDTLTAYIEQHEVSLHSISRRKLTRNAHHGLTLLGSDTSFQTSIASDGGEAGSVGQFFSMSSQLDQFMQSLKQCQIYRCNQLHRINKLFDHDVNIDTECNLEILTVDEENRRYNQYEYEEFLLGIDGIPTDAEGDAVQHSHPEADLYDVADTLVEKLSLSRRERNNKLNLVIQSLTSICYHSTLSTDKIDVTSACAGPVGIDQRHALDDMASPSLQSIADHW